MVEKLQLQTKRHPHPYRMQWLYDCGAIKVSRSVRVPISVGAYVDQVECDVVPMHACHLLLGTLGCMTVMCKSAGVQIIYALVMEEENIHGYP
jgi:hypothetical protein